LTLVNAVTRDLPTTIANYLRLPHAYATFHQIEGGRTAKQLLLEQLDLLHGQLTKIADSAYRDDAEALVVNGKYLKEKFHPTVFLPAGAVGDRYVPTTPPSSRRITTVADRGRPSGR